MVVGDERTKWLDAMTLCGQWETWPCPGTPQVRPLALQASWPGLLRRVQIKNIKLHIVTDIKVNFNSMLGFRISNLVGGKGTLTRQLKIFSHFSASLPVPCHRVHTPCCKISSPAKDPSQLSCRTKKPTAPGVPRRSPIQVLSWPDDA